MNLMVRPSKSFLYDLLEKELSSARGEIGLDAAAANFKNQKMFRTRFYYGIDYDFGLLKQGIAAHNNPNTFGIHADLSQLSQIPDNSIDVVVSTNTLYQINPEQRKLALEELCRVASPGGVFICELLLDKDFDASIKQIKSYFSETRVRYYRNPVSRIYEGLFERNGSLGSHPIAGTRLFRLIAWLLSRLEYLTWDIRRLNRHAFIVSRGKVGTTQRFNLSGVSLKEGRIYEMMDGKPNPNQLL